MTGTSPPGPLRCGSTTCSVNAVATAASKAFPPRSKIPMPTAVAIQCVEVTTPKVPSISGRVVKVFGLTLVMNDLGVLLIIGAFERTVAPARLRDPWLPHRHIMYLMYRAARAATRAVNGRGERAS